MIKKLGFTLAEVLITLAIIGVVAVLTVPTLITNNQEKGWNTASKVFEAKLEQALKVMNTQGTLAGYRTTKDFVDELSNHLKIVKVCDSDKLTDCFADKVYWGADKEEVDISSIARASDFGQNDWGTELVGIQLANGTNGIVAYNPDCKQNQFSNQITGTSCLAILYDTSGYSKPNTQNKDLRSINVASLGGEDCAFKIGSTCWGTPFMASPLTKTECEAHMSELNIQYCDYDTDYWAGAVKACKEQGKRLPTETELKALAEDMYGTFTRTNTDENNIITYYGTLNTSKASSYGFLSNTPFENGNFAVYSSHEMYSQEEGISGAFLQGFESDSTTFAPVPRNWEGYGTICVK